MCRFVTIGYTYMDDSLLARRSGSYFMSCAVGVQFDPKKIPQKAIIFNRVGGGKNGDSTCRGPRVKNTKTPYQLYSISIIDIVFTEFSSVHHGKVPEIN